MKVDIIFLVASIILFVLSISYWFISGLVRRRKPYLSRKYDKIGGFMFFTSLLGFTLALLFWLVI